MPPAAISMPRVIGSRGPIRGRILAVATVATTDSTAIIGRNASPVLIGEKLSVCCR